MIGTTLGRYRVLAPLGEGGMGRVYLAEDPSLGRKLAVKVLPPEVSSDPERRTRLLHEARAASALNHPNILVIHDLGESDGALFVAMELIEGSTVRDWARSAPRAPRDVLRLMRQALAALAVAHAAGLVHRDLKPENMMVRADGLLKILDFGLARSVSPGTAARTATMPGTVMGTAPYMSPEQVLGQSAGPASDLFSIGSVLYELVTGRHPFAAESPIETMHRILHESPEPPSRVNRALTADFDFVLAKALSKDPGRRHASAKDLDVDLETLECGCRAATPSPATAAAGGPRAIAVLPFKNIGGDPGLAYLGIGLADAVINRLSDSPDLIVRATGSIAAYQDQPVDPRRVAGELDVSAVLDASFQRAGERFRATARLVEAPSGRSLWAGKVDLRFEDIFEVQDQVAHGIAAALTARLAGPERERARQFVPSPEAYDLVLRAQEGPREATRSGFLRSAELLERAVALEPNYADALAELAHIYHGMLDGGFDADPGWFAKAEATASRALAIDPEHARARFAIANLHLVRGAKRDAYREMVAVHRLRPHDSFVHHYFAYLFRLCDMLREARGAELRARELDPSFPWAQWGLVHAEVLLGNLRTAREQLDAGRSRFGRHSHFNLSEMLILRAERRYGEIVALAEATKADASTAGARVEFEYAFALLKTGQRERALAAIAPFESFAPHDMDQAAFMAAFRANLGEADAAFAHLDRAVQLGNDMLTRYSDPDLYGPLHGDPRWEPFLSGVRRRVAAWKRELRWPPA